MAVDLDLAFLLKRPELLVDRLATGAQHLGKRPLGEIEIDHRHLALDAAVKNRELAEQDQKPMAKVMEDCLVRLLSFRWFTDFAAPFQLHFKLISLFGSLIFLTNILLISKIGAIWVLLPGTNPGDTLGAVAEVIAIGW